MEEGHFCFEPMQSSASNTMFLLIQHVQCSKAGRRWDVTVSSPDFPCGSAFNPQCGRLFLKAFFEEILCNTVEILLFLLLGETKEPMKIIVTGV